MSAKAKRFSVGFILFLCLGLMGWSLLSVGNSTAQQSANATVLYSKTYTISALHLLLDVSYIKGLAPQQAVVRLTKLSDNKEIRGGTLRLNQQQLTIRPFLRGDETVMEAEVTIDANMLAWMYLRGDPKAKLKLEILKKDDAPPPAPEATLTVSPQELRHGEQATLTWSSTHADSVTIEPGIGAVATSGSLEISPSASTTYTLTATGPGGTTTAQAAVVVRSGVQPQPRASYGELYEDLIPADAGKAVYDPDRFAMVNGRIFDIQGQPLPGVAVRVLRAEGDYGTAYTDADGNYTLPVEGGGLITLRFTKDGYAEAQRSAMTEWNNWTTFEDAALVRYDEKSTVIAPDGNPAHVFVHQSTVITDEDGTRGVTMGFPGDIKAFRIEDNGTETELPSFTVRATEYTTPESMPAILPPTSAFTWCAEFSLDEALDKPVQFTKPVTVWLDNFLGFEAGTMVPVGFYDRKEGAWIASENGVVVKLVDTNGDGIADGVDATGDNEPEDLNEDGSVTDELTGLTAEQLQGIGNTYWRVEVRHFSPWDLNWYTPPPPSDPRPTDSPTGLGGSPASDCPTSVASSVTNRNRELLQDVAIAGTELSLNYASGRAATRGQAFRIPISGDLDVARFISIKVQIDVSGKSYSFTFPAQPNLAMNFEWDGLDRFGNPARDKAIYVRISYYYLGRYASGEWAEHQNPETRESLFARILNAESGVDSRRVSSMGRTLRIPVAALPPMPKTAFDIAHGWTLSAVQGVATTPDGAKAIRQGNGADVLVSIKRGHLIAGNGTEAPENVEGSNGQDVSLTFQDLTVGPDGTFYFSDGRYYQNQDYPPHRSILSMARNGTLAAVAGQGSDCNGGAPVFPIPNGTPAANICTVNLGNLHVNPQGSIVFTMAEENGHGLYRIDARSQTVQHLHSVDLARYENNAPSGDEQFRSVTSDTHGNIFFAKSRDRLIQMIDVEGSTRTMAGGGSETSDGPASTRAIRPRSLQVGPEGDLYFIDDGSWSYEQRIRKLDASGNIVTVAGGGRTQVSYLPASARIPALDAIINAKDIAFDANGNLLFNSDYGPVRRLDPDGYIVTPTGEFPDVPVITNAERLLASPDGQLYYTAGGWLYRYEAIPVFPYPLQPTDKVLPHEGLGYVFNLRKQHVRTISLYPMRTLESFTYDAQGRLSAVTDSFNRTTSLERDANGRATAFVSPDGLRTALTLDENDRLVAVTAPDGAVTRFEYDDWGRMLATVKPEGNRFWYIYDGTGYVNVVQDEVGGRWAFGREFIGDNNASYSTVQTAEGDTTTYHDINNATGFYSTITSPSGDVTQYFRDPNGIRVDKQLACGTTINATMGLDPRFGHMIPREVRRTLAPGKSTTTTLSIDYDDMDGNGIADIMRKRVYENDKETLLEDDFAQGLTSVTSPMGRITQQFYNPATLLPTRSSTAGLLDTTFEHDDKGRLTRQATGNRTTAYTYDAQGNLATVTGSDNRTVAYSHDAAGRVTAIERPDATTVRFVYDQNGNMRVLTVPTDVDHAFDYNKVDLNTEYETPLSGSYQYLYDKDRRLVKTIFPGGRSIDNHYVDGLLRSVTTPEGQIIYDYACGSKVTSMVMGDESLTFAYDGSLMTSLSQSGELDATIGFQYDDTGELAGLTYAGETIAFTYDLDDLTTKVGDFAIARDAQNGLPLAVSDGTATLSRSFNGYGEVETETLAVAGTPVGVVRLERNTIGHITRKTETVAAATQVYDYEYDSMGRLTRVVDGNGTLLEAYTYGQQGERLTQYSLWFDIGNRTYEYDAEDRLLRAGDTQYEYNADGFLTRKITANATVEYTYSSRGETKTVDLGNGTVVAYRHDVLGRPASKSVNGEVTEKYLWLGRTRLLAIYNADDTVKQRFQYADGRMPLAMVQDGELFYFAYDQVGSLRAVTDASGNVVKNVLYDSFGRVISDSNPELKVPFGFAGGLQDSDTGLVRFGYRDYDPDLGRWTAKDPIGFEGGDSNLFNYVIHNPINFVDEIGLQVGPPSQSCNAVQWENCHQECAASGKRCASCRVNSITIDLSPLLVAYPWWVQCGCEDNIDACEKTTTEHVKRKEPGADGADSEHIIEKQNGETISRTHRVTKDGKVIHQHQDHIGKSGQPRSFPEEWLEHPTIK